MATPSPHQLLKLLFMISFLIVPKACGQVDHSSGQDEDDGKQNLHLDTKVTNDALAVLAIEMKSTDSDIEKSGLTQCVHSRDVHALAAGCTARLTDSVTRRIRRSDAPPNEWHDETPKAGDDAAPLPEARVVNDSDPKQERANWKAEVVQEAAVNRRTAQFCVVIGSLVVGSLLLLVLAKRIGLVRDPMHRALES